MKIIKEPEGPTPFKPITISITFKSKEEVNSFFWSMTHNRDPINPDVEYGAHTISWICATIAKMLRKV